SCASTMARRALAVRVIASAIVRPSSDLSCRATNGLLARPAEATGWPQVEPFVHKRPKFAGWDLSPDTFAILPELTSMTMPQPTPQYGQTLLTAFFVTPASLRF